MQTEREDVSQMTGLEKMTAKIIADAEAQAREISASFLPQGFDAEIKIIKRVPDKQSLKEKIYQYILIS